MNPEGGMGVSDALQTFAAQMIPAIERELRAVLRADDRPGDPFYGMMHYHMGWANEDLKAASVNSGKRVRPLLCLLACAAAGGDWQQAVPAAAAIEILHNFTLIHDDIQDASPTRRGRRTVWKLWGEAQAINTGDAMFALAHLAAVRLEDRGVPPQVVVHALRRLDETCLELTIGQNADMCFERRDDVTTGEYLAMIDGKTAALVALSGELGALVAGRAAAIVAHYASFGRELGLAFQVRDDILGIWGDEAVIGKSSTTDIATRKKSLPVLYALEQSEAFRRLYRSPASDDEFVSQAVALLDVAGARPFAEGYEAGYAQSALAHLREAIPQGEAAPALRQLAYQLLGRQA
jgi:geranylgeranyl diphosphate synthase type I